MEGLVDVDQCVDESSAMGGGKRKTSVGNGEVGRWIIGGEIQVECLRKLHSDLVKGLV